MAMANEANAARQESCNEKRIKISAIRPCCPNSAAYESCWGSFVVRPDGVIVSQLKRKESGIVLTDIDASKQYYDSTAPWRQRSMAHNYHSGPEVEKEPRLLCKNEF